MIDSDMDKNSLGEILHALGKMEGMLSAMFSRMDGIESKHAQEMDNTKTRLNNHSERIKNLETNQARSSGEVNGRRMILGMVVTILLLAGGIAAWWFMNGLSILQAGAKAGGGG